ncbi:uncharacterized protein A4U43_C04F27610 [Asparagus officinalis]|uniref:Uncharacterized protein n=1 Tax=Asparagus officinalis TaxID=4686 RepID=A0A5P1F448_ASPOF|nr:proline-rich receptor-like protein kinase PERK2 [Asparagus officinalis]ONK73135.1 uncharacterized protein A4U43_C04F27610 [Asparagus officinalis]
MASAASAAGPPPGLPTRRRPLRHLVHLAPATRLPLPHLPPPPLRRRRRRQGVAGAVPPARTLGRLLFLLARSLPSTPPLPLPLRRAPSSASGSTRTPSSAPGLRLLGAHLSLLASGVIPQELSPSLLWAPVFEYTPPADASASASSSTAARSGEDSSPPAPSPPSPGCTSSSSSRNRSLPPLLSPLAPPSAAARQELRRRRPALMSPASAAGDEPKAQFSKLAFGIGGASRSCFCRVRQRVPTDLRAFSVCQQLGGGEMMVADRRLRPDSDA